MPRKGRVLVHDVVCVFVLLHFAALTAHNVDSCSRQQLLLQMKWEDFTQKLRCQTLWLAQWMVLGLSLPGLLFGWAVIAWSCFLFVVGALLLSGVRQIFSPCTIHGASSTATYVTNTEKTTNK